MTTHDSNRMAVALQTEVAPTKKIAPRAQLSASCSRPSDFTRLLCCIPSGIVSAFEWLVGLAALVVGLSVLATIPLVQFISLGYLLESAARVARSGRLRDGFVGIRTAARMGTTALVGLLLLLPIRLLSDLVQSARLLENSTAVISLTFLTAVSAVLYVLMLAWGIARGGRLRSFLWPAPWRLCKSIHNGEFSRSFVEQLIDWSKRSHFPQLFWLGLRGAIVAAAWLAIPITLLVISTRLPEAPAALLAFVGAVLFAAVQMYLPFLQANFAKSNQLRQGFALRETRDQFCSAPVAFLIGLIATLVLAVPLYALKAELLPREAAWLPSIVFVLSIWPARLLVGWAISRADNHLQPRHAFFRWTSRAAIVPLVLFYALIVYLTQYLSWYGVWSLYEQHAYLLPVPFIGL